METYLVQPRRGKGVFVQVSAAVVVEVHGGNPPCLINQLIN